MFHQNGYRNHAAPMLWNDTQPQTADSHRKEWSEQGTISMDGVPDPLSGEKYTLKQPLQVVCFYKIKETL